MSFKYIFCIISNPDLLKKINRNNYYETIKVLLTSLQLVHQTVYYVRMLENAVVVKKDIS